MSTLRQRSPRRSSYRSWGVGVAAGVTVTVVALASVAVGRAGSPGSQADAPPAGGVKTAQRGGAAGAVEIAATDGRTVTIPASRPTVLYFMAAWCASCLPEAAAMAELEDEYRDRADFVAVDVTPNAPAGDIRRFQAAAGNPEHPYVVDARGELMGRFEVTTLDTTVVIDATGEVLDRRDAQPLSTDQLRAFLDDTLDDAPDVALDGDGASSGR